MWISENLFIPFWIIGHIHLTMNIYEDFYEIFASLSMSIIVTLGFLFCTKNEKKRYINRIN